jgi:hypothetical protein
MGDVIGFPHGFRGDGSGPVDPPCECEDGTGYRLRPEILPEPVSSISFPYVKAILLAEGCIAKVQLSQSEWVDIPLDEGSAADMVEILGQFLGRSYRKGG